MSHESSPPSIESLQLELSNTKSRAVAKIRSLQSTVDQLQAQVEQLKLQQQTPETSSSEDGGDFVKVGPSAAASREREAALLAREAALRDRESALAARESALVAAHSGASPWHGELLVQLRTIRDVCAAR